ncbi:MAG TPA: S9 family peptidase [Bryobacteraceae bacterium]|jgi:oligopeptidase B|nr:S9 family peptidase [Bryobacteraceae bacterium]
METEAQSVPPIAKVAPKVLTALGDSRVDDYYWLREKDDPDVRGYLEAENEYTAAVMKDTEQLQTQLYEEMLARIQEDDSDVPHRKGSYLYYIRTQKGKPYPIHCRKKTSEGKEEILLDQNKMAEGFPYFALGNFLVSPDEELLAYSSNTDGDETYTLQVRNLVTGVVYPDAIPNTYYSLAWSGDNRHIFYVTLDSSKRPYRIWRHELGEANDTLVYEEKDERFELSLATSRDGKTIFIESESKITSEVRYLPAGDALGNFRVIWPRRDDILYDVQAHGDRFYIRTNDGAKDFRLVEVSAAQTDPALAKEVLPARKGVFLEHVEVFQGFFAAFERQDGLPRILVRNLQRTEDHFVAFDEAAYVVLPDANEVFETATLRFRYSSMVTPWSTYDYDMAAQSRVLLKRQPVLGGYDPGEYTSERLFVPARDGARIPVSMVYRKGAVLDGHSPMLLYGYGSYGVIIEPAFSSARVSLLDRGFIYAIAHIRGGAEMGRSWYEDGKILNKKNTFNDFVDAAQYLVDRRYTSPERLAVQGRSAGGLLMGAVTNLRPDLFRGVVAEVPFVDVLTTDLDSTLPLTVGEYEEWGNANEQPFYDYIKSYSPYDNLERKAYPNILATTGLNDPRVSYWEPAKWVAKLRVMKADGNLLLLKTNLNAGHGGASDRYEKLRETAFVYAFVIKCLGVSGCPQS